MALFQNTLICLLCLFSFTTSLDTTSELTLDNLRKDEFPKIKKKATYEVKLIEDIEYAKALSHESFTNKNATEIPLKLDLYYPENAIKNRPAYLFIHGGGFVKGDKQQVTIKRLANFYTSRGWVFVSINYRLLRDYGTVPQKWLDFANNLPKWRSNKASAIYPAQRDAKAALRWLVANAKTYNINPNFITVGGGSAGAITAIVAGVSAPEDFRDEIKQTIDPTLATTHLNHEYKVRTIINLWGSKIALTVFETIYGYNRFDKNCPPLFTAHGTNDETVPYSNAEDLKTIWKKNGIPHVLYALEGKGHGPWNVTVNGKSLEELAFDFIVKQQNLIVEQ